MVIGQPECSVPLDVDCKAPSLSVFLESFACFCCVMPSDIGPGRRLAEAPEGAGERTCPTFLMRMDEAHFKLITHLPKSF